MTNEMSTLIYKVSVAGNMSGRVEAEYNVTNRAKALFERLTLGTETHLLQGLSDEQASAEAAVYLLWKALGHG